MRKSILVVMATMLVLALATLAVAADDPFVGTWKLNLAKSKYPSGMAPKSETIKFEAHGNGFNVVIDAVDSKGTQNHSEWPVHFDGKEYPAQPNIYDDSDKFVSTRVDANTISYVFKKAGKELSRRKGVVSKDGKTLTTTAQLKSAKGEAVAITEVFDRQLATAAMGGDDPFVGIWKLNIAKSKASGPSWMPRNDTIKIVAQDNGVKMTIDNVDAKGKAYHLVWAGKYDDKDYPITGDPAVDTTAIKKVNANTMVMVDKKAGREVGAWRVTVSKDGKTRAVAFKGKDAKGLTFTLDGVYDKQ